jgi:GTPase SAR1 family protein
MTLNEIKQAYKEIFYIENDELLDLMCAIAISCWTKSDAIWLLIIGAPSSGKTEFVNTLAGLEFAHQISSMTENSFLSAMPGSDGKEKSLLHRIGKNGMILMKDYTSILSLKEELRKKILGDMREIYEGWIKKETGTGKKLEWKGKINFVGAVTDSIYLGEGDDASMGRRTIDYVMPHLTSTVRIKMAKRSSQNIGDAQTKRDKLKVMFAEFIEIKRKELPEVLPSLPEELLNELITIADFSTQMRTATKRDFHGNLMFAPENEAPMRMSNQLMILAQVLIFLNDGILKQEHHDILCKVALDSISRQRRVTLQVLAKYSAVTTKGLAQELNYPTKTTLSWLEDINVIGGCSRYLAGSSDMWKLNKNAREIMIKYDNITPINEDLMGNESYDSYRGEDPANFDAGTIAEAERKATKDLDNFDDKPIKLPY